MTRPSEPRFVFLIGTQRSGTTWLGKLFSDSTDVAYWSEPRQVWVCGNWFGPDDSLGAKDASPRIARYIRRRFSKFARKQGKPVFFEKTPSNCLRVPFMHQVFPDAKFIFVVRDGRAVLRSTDEIQAGGVRWGRLLERVRETHPYEIPAYLDRLGWLWKKITRQKLDDWGIRPPGWKEWQSSLSPFQVIAMQWKVAIETAMNDRKMIDDKNQIVIHYEDLIRSPTEEVERIGKFAGIRDYVRIGTLAASEVKPESEEKWKHEISAAVLEEVRPILEPALQRLGYDWSDSTGNGQT